MTDAELNRKGLLVAIRRKELDEFLTGRGLYRLGYNQYAPGNSMLNLAPAMEAIYSYYREAPSARVDLVLEDALLDWLTWKSGIGVYAVFSFLSYQLKMEQSNESPFSVNRTKLIDELKKVLAIYGDKLKVRKDYEGENLKEGLWEAMQIENQINIDKYNIQIL